MDKMIDRRRISFRAWNSLTETWQHDKQFGGCHVLGENMLMGGWMNGVSLEKLNYIIVEQFTGFFDKNNEDIFEGDIIKCISTVPMTEGKEYFVEVVWAAGSWMVKGMESQHEYLFKWMSSHWIEVVGNIHENKELLNEYND